MYSMSGYYYYFSTDLLNVMCSSLLSRARTTTGTSTGTGVSYFQCLVLEERPCAQESSRTILQVLVLVRGYQVIVLVLILILVPSVLILVLVCGMWIPSS